MHKHQHRVRPLAMTNIRQRKVDPSPSSRGTMYPQEEMMRIVIEPDDNTNAELEDHDSDLHSYHYTPRPSRMIPDKRYKDYLQGRMSKRKDDVSVCPTGPECACHCIAFSWIAVAFLVSAALLPCTGLLHHSIYIVILCEMYFETLLTVTHA